jgi:hypothetical protein
MLSIVITFTIYNQGRDEEDNGTGKKFILPLMMCNLTLKNWLHSVCSQVPTGLWPCRAVPCISFPILRYKGEEPADVINSLKSAVSVFKYETEGLEVLTAVVMRVLSAGI